jgi:hypothetical protein
MTRRGNGAGRGGPANGNGHGAPRGAGRGGPANGASTANAAEPFGEGNDLAVRHGALSPRLVSDDAATLLTELRASGAPWLDDVDGTALDAWLVAEAACRRLRAWCDKHGLIDGRGRPKPAAELLLRFERQAAGARSALGFDPVARARLGRDTAVARQAAADALRRVEAQGREARLRAVGSRDGRSQ